MSRRRETKRAKRIARMREQMFPYISFIKQQGQGFLGDCAPLVSMSDQSIQGVASLVLQANIDGVEVKLAVSNAAKAEWKKRFALEFKHNDTWAIDAHAKVYA